MLRSFLARSLLAGLIAGFGALPALAQATNAAFNADQKKQIESMIHDYILQHPEVVQEAMVELEKRQKDAEKQSREKITLDKAGPLYTSKYQMVLGNPKGDVTLVEFFDYNCGYCKKALSDNLKLLETDKNLRLVLKEFPVLGQGSVEASQVAMAARESMKPEQMAQFHTKLLGLRGPANKDKALEVAKDIGLDTAKITKDMAKPEIATGIQESVSLADQLGLTGTPSFVLGGEVIVGAVGYDEIKEKIDAVRKCGKTSCS